jgi:hypothetical protein
MHKLSLMRNELRASLWFLPGLIAACSIALVEVDGRVSREFHNQVGGHGGRHPEPHRVSRRRFI